MGVVDELVPVCGQVLQASVAPIDVGQPVGLVDRDAAQPRERGAPFGLGAEQRHPRRLAGVFDQLAPRADGARDRALEVAVV